MCSPAPCASPGTALASQTRPLSRSLSLSLSLSLALALTLTLPLLLTPTRCALLLGLLCHPAAAAPDTRAAAALGGFYALLLPLAATRSGLGLGLGLGLGMG